MESSPEGETGGSVLIYAQMSGLKKNDFCLVSCTAWRAPREPLFRGARSLTSGSFTSFFTVTIMLLHFSYGTGNQGSTSRSNSGS